MSQRFFSLVFLFFLYSCQLFVPKEVKEEQLLQELLEEINWQEVTQYPTLSACDSIFDNQIRKECFFQTLADWLQDQLEAEPLHMDGIIQDTLPVKVTIRHDSSMLFEPQFPENASYNTQKIDSLLQNRWLLIPDVAPALKQDIPVTTQFMVQVILTQKISY